MQRKKNQAGYFSRGKEHYYYAPHWKLKYSKYVKIILDLISDQWLNVCFYREHFYMYFWEATSTIFKNVTKLRFSETGGQTEEATRTQNSPATEILFEVNRITLGVRTRFERLGAGFDKYTSHGLWLKLNIFIRMCSFDNYDTIILEMQECCVFLYLWIVS